MGRRDPGRLQPGLLQGPRTISSHQQRETRRIPAGAQPRRRRDLVGRAATAARRPGRHAGHAPRTHAPGVVPRAAHRSSRPDRFHPSRLRHDRPHGEHQRGNVAFLFFVRSRPHVARPVPAAAVRPERSHGPHRHDRERPERLPPLPDRLEDQRPGRPAVLRPHDRRRAHLALPLVHRARADRLLHHALDGAPLGRPTS